MSEERTRILRMVSEGQITVEEGARLLGALNGEASEVEAPTTRSPRWFHVRVTNLETGKAKVKVNLPMPLVKAGIKIGARYASDTEEIDWEELIAAIQEGASGKLVEVEDQEGGERVEIYVD
ncbi:MAG: hypothetical protein ISS56_11345 [Anaerolineae bacterium]|nr:hypothetical protein [Anaerolineae bacterium]